MNFCKRSYQPILRYLYTETIKRRGEISLHEHFKSDFPICSDLKDFLISKLSKHRLLLKFRLQDLSVVLVCGRFRALVMNALSLKCFLNSMSSCFRTDGL